ncbi:hypothetical protein BC939DRAFT_438493 [Gamsiella multidivaricata]|uniref:uncharacterized protein n=1 Tax=Gamsiella multidivaricata TaxID=101098 RepID=UPI0022203AFF|nr:uncharacterized protein BC939DRAFT_438493 [Gamsiella multidivaricata]KAI7830603.1 hypothetical protein BC939DRAFT_438493 [Gamsiella multidivaricata]
MSTAPGLAHSVPPLQTGSKCCSRCGKDFHLFRQKKHCYNCGSLVCESCSNYRARLPQFGYVEEVRCCAYCAHFLQVSKMDYAALSKLNIKTLRGYLLSYNIPTQGMLEKQDLVRAIQSHKPIPEASEVYFRRHLPPTPDKSSSFFEELTGIGRSDSPSGSSQGSSSSNSGEGWSWDVDKFFSKLFGGDDRQSNSSGRTRQSRSHSQPHPPQQTQPQPYTQPQQQRQSRPAPADYRPQPQVPRPANAGATHPNVSYQHPGFSYRTPAYDPPPIRTSIQRPSSHPQTFNTSWTPQPSRPTVATSVPRTTSASRPPPSPAQSMPRTVPTPRPSAATSAPRAPSTPRTTPVASSAPSSSQRQTPLSPTLTLEQLMSSQTNPSTLSIKTIKTILDDSFVTYVGVVEKRDLVERLQKLIDNTRAEQEMVQEQEAAAESKKVSESSKGPSGGGSSEDDNLCKICCDAALNCVMLNCNHMSTCMDCGKLIMEGSRMCPICREYVVRLLHVFRA